GGTAGDADEVYRIVRGLEDYRQAKERTAEGRHEEATGVLVAGAAADIAAADDELLKRDTHGSTRHGIRRGGAALLVSAVVVVMTFVGPMLRSGPAGVNVAAAFATGSPDRRVSLDLGGGP